MKPCECDVTENHNGGPCPNESAHHENEVTTDPALCLPCLFGCMP